MAKDKDYETDQVSEMFNILPGMPTDDKES
jgi:hypothetical protein